MDNNDNEDMLYNTMIISILDRLSAQGNLWRMFRGSPQCNCPDTHQKILDANNYYKYIMKNVWK